MSNENGPVQSVAKALRLLGLLMEAHQPLTLAALSKQTGWPKSTIHGLLSTMRESAVVDQQSDGRYCLGVRLFEYGCAVGASWSVSDLAKPHLQHLASVTGQSVFLSMLNRSEVITIEQVQSRAGLRVVSEVGTRRPRPGRGARQPSHRLRAGSSAAAALHLAGQGVSIRDGRPRGEARPVAPHIGALYAQDPRHVGGALPCDAGRA